MLIDAHAHLDQYPDAVLASVLEEIVTHRIVTVSVAMDLSSFERARQIAARSNLVLPAFGIHPRNAVAYAHRLADLDGAIERSAMLGEIGLDHRRRALEFGGFLRCQRQFDHLFQESNCPTG